MATMPRATTSNPELALPSAPDCDLIVAAIRTKSNTLNSPLNRVGTGTFGGYAMASGAEKPKPVLQMILEALGLRNQSQSREPTSKDIGTLISE